MQLAVPKPQHRHPWRRMLGKFYYQARRCYAWRFSGDQFAIRKAAADFPFVVKQHQSFLLRPLKDVHMQLQHNKVTNLRLAIGAIHNLVLKPGEIFSFWYLVGKPTAQKGYLPGLVLNQGKIESGVGGGLCQLGNLIFWMAAHTPLTIRERYRHGYDVFPDVNRTIPFGAGATLSYNYIDIQLKNETQYAYQLKFWLSTEYLHGEIRCEHEPDKHYEVYESEHRIQHQVWGGYTRHNRLNRKVTDREKQLVRDEFFLENHAVMMYEPLLTSGSYAPHHK